MIAKIRVRTAMVSARSDMPKGSTASTTATDQQGQVGARCRTVLQAGIVTVRLGRHLAVDHVGHGFAPNMPWGRKKRTSTNTAKTRISEPVPGR